ncbi:MAG: peptidylprolyl isomerase, partial [Alphaproteobacteria bacterium]|nr:peptidylprolyl isomerase [Alphaproteobacteria bacterium]
IVINKKDAKDLNGLVEVLRQDPRFELYAMQFSQSPSAANGGKLGWIVKGKLPTVLENTVIKLKEGGVSNPVAYGNDYYIFKMDKIFNPQTDAQSLPDRNQVKRYLENKKLEEYSNKYIKNLRNRALIEKKV